MMTYIVYLIFTAFFLAILHFVVEGIAAPAARWHYRLEVFALRDKLRMLRLSEPENISPEAFEALESGVNNTISLIKVFDFWFAMKTRSHLQSNPDLEKRIERRYRAAEECTNEEFHEIAGRLNVILTTIMMWNSAGWFIYIIPLAICLALMEQTARWIRKWFMLLSPSDLNAVSQSSGLSFEPAQ